ncbi:MAG TPA: tetratricopeptide repeat protein [Gemmatimonadaceae bacterium]|nr:tetratricopeptide repeat protein [Gemmatimonadaceae bacterium]
MTKTGEAARPPRDLDTDSLLDTIRARRREITIGVIALAAIGGTFYVWRESVLKKEENAERALNTAANSYYSGNKALAQSDLERMVVRYGDTSAGVQGAMLLAQILYEGGKWPEGIAKLEAAAARSSGRRFSAALQGLIATGFADQQKYDDAAKHYLRASDEAPFPADKDLYRADAARILMLAGKQDDARKIWAALASKLDSPVLGEAKIRLGELSVVPPAKN